MGPEFADYYMLHRQLLQSLEAYRLDVSVNKNLDESLRFAQFVLNSHLLNILAPHDTAGPLKIDSGDLRSRATQLAAQVREQWSKGFKPVTEEALMSTIDRKLDLLAARVAMIPGADREPLQANLRVIQGGVSGGDGP